MYFESNNVNLNRFCAGKQDGFINRFSMGVSYFDTHEHSIGDLLNKGASLSISIFLPGVSSVGLSLNQTEQVFGRQTYDLTQTAVSVSKRAIDGLNYFGNILWADQIDFANNRLGDALIVSPNLEYAINQHMLVRLGHTYNNLDVPEGNLSRVNLTDLRFSYQFNPKSSLRLILIHNYVTRSPERYAFPIYRTSKSTNAQLLYAYELNGQSQLFAGYSTSSIDNDQLSGLEKTADTIFVKLSYAWRMQRAPLPCDDRR